MNLTGKNIKLLRKKYSLSQDQLAKICYVTRQAVSKWESGKANPSIDVLMKLAKVFSVTPDSIYNENLDKEVYTINICNGYSLYSYLQANFNDLFIPYYENIYKGCNCNKMLSSEYIVDRSFYLNLTIDNYLDQQRLFLDTINDLSGNEKIILWFTTDYISQINLLSVLAFIEEKNFSGLVYEICIDDVTKRIARPMTQIQLGKFRFTFTEVILNKNLIITDDSYLNKAIKIHLQVDNKNTIIKDKLSRLNDKNLPPETLQTIHMNKRNNNKE